MRWYMWYERQEPSPDHSERPARLPDTVEQQGAAIAHAFLDSPFVHAECPELGYSVASEGVKGGTNYPVALTGDETRPYHSFLTYDTRVADTIREQYQRYKKLGESLAQTLFILQNLFDTRFPRNANPQREREQCLRRSALVSTDTLIQAGNHMCLETSLVFADLLHRAWYPCHLIAGEMTINSKTEKHAYLTVDTPTWPIVFDPTNGTPWHDGYIYPRTGVITRCVAGTMNSWEEVEADVAWWRYGR